MQWRGIYNSLRGTVKLVGSMWQYLDDILETSLMKMNMVRIVGIKMFPKAGEVYKSTW